VIEDCEPQDDPFLVTDPRTEKQQRADRRAAAAQARALSRQRGKDGFDRRVVEAVLRRRSDPGTDDPPLACAPYDRGGRDGVVLLVAGELVVRTGMPQAGHDAVLARLPGASREDRQDVPGITLYRDPGADVTRLVQVAAELRALGHPASASHVTPLRVVIKGLGGPEPTRVDLRREVATDEAGPHVAVIDSGVWPRRDDGWLDGTDDLDGPASHDPLDEFPWPCGNDLLDFAAGHGTFVAGVVRQVLPTAKVSVLRAFDGDGVASEVAVAAAMLRAVGAGAHVLNLSLGVQTVDDQPLLAVQVALELIEREAPDVVTVAAAGNYGDDRPCFPAAAKDVVAVGALTHDLGPATWSSRGHWVDCSAVGEGVVSTFVPGEEETDQDPRPDTWPDDGHPWAVWSGTSFAAPQVAALVARTMAERSVGARAALQQVLDSGRPAPDVGRVLAVLPGTARA
jgi:subtilisin family serine protease